MRHVPQRYSGEPIPEKGDRGRDRAHVIAPKAHERRVAAALKGKRVKGSGCSPYAKGDVVAAGTSETAGWLVECKRTDKASLAIKREWLVKVTREALVQGKRPALSVEIGGGALANDVEGTWVAVPLSAFVALTQREQEMSDGHE